MEDENYNPNHIFISRFEEGNGVLKNCLEYSPSHEEIAQVQGETYWIYTQNKLNELYSLEEKIRICSSIPQFNA